MTYDGKTNTITLGKTADKSTIIGDLGVSWIYELRSDAARPDVPSTILADWKIIESYLGCAGREFNQQDHAKIAAVVRSYYAKGISPSFALESQFESFSKWARSENWTLVQIPPELASVFDRMLASDEEIEVKRKSDVQKAKSSAQSRSREHSSVGKVTHYANNKYMCCCSIKLESGERIMISIAAALNPSVKIYKMGLLGMLPVHTIWEYNPMMAGGYDAYVRKMMKMLQDPLSDDPKHPLDILRDLLLPCQSILEIRDLLFDAERSISE